MTALLAVCLHADDYRWVKGTFSWKGNGTLTTQVIPLYGESYRVNYASPQKGALRITVVDAAPRGALPTKEIVNTQKVFQPGSKSASGPQNAMLIIEGDGRPWEVRVDQCLSSIQEWKLKLFLKEQQKPVERLAVWTGTGSEELIFDGKSAPWKIRVAQEGDGVVAVSVKSEKSKSYYQTQLYGNGQKGEGWIPAAGTVTINVIASDTDWSIEAVK
ncbi:MAG: hypothetical protein IKR13_02370 [Victivallales bacterium]|nr:hypothetical protein [Victivallales bacterium]